MTNDMLHPQCIHLLFPLPVQHKLKIKFTTFTTVKTCKKQHGNNKCKTVVPLTKTHMQYATHTHTFWGTEKPLVPARTRNPDCPDCNQSLH